MGGGAWLCCCEGGRKGRRWKLGREKATSRLRQHVHVKAQLRPPRAHLDALLILSYSPIHQFTSIILGIDSITCIRLWAHSWFKSWSIRLAPSFTSRPWSLARVPKITGLALSPGRAYYWGLHSFILPGRLHWSRPEDLVRPAASPEAITRPHRSYFMVHGRASGTTSRGHRKRAGPLKEKTYSLELYGQDKETENTYNLDLATPTPSLYTHEPIKTRSSSTDPHRTCHDRLLDSCSSAQHSSSTAPCSHPPPG